jgi:transposase
MAFRIVYSNQTTDNNLRKLFSKKLDNKKISCRKCNKDKLSWISDTRYRCKNCWSFGSLTTGTFLERSKISLRLWYELVWCFVLSHSANKAKKLLGIDYKDTFKVYGLIRKALVKESRSERKKLTGTMEVDESYYGGLFKNLRKETRWKYRYEGKAKRGRGAKYRKQPVFGIYKRNGSVYLELITECSKEELEKVIKKKIKKASEVFSDTFKSYDNLVGLGYIHQTVDHGMEIYVDGRVHVNGMEGFWGLSKTNMHTYKGIRKKNWLLYLKEMEFRYNYRKLNFEEMVEKIIKILMSYRE